MRTIISKKFFLAVMLAGMAAVALSIPAAAVAQDTPDDPDQTRTRLRSRLMECIEGDEALQGQERIRMRENLDQGLECGMNGADLETLFGGGELTKLQTRTRLRIQERIIQSAAEDLPVEPVMDKLREGAMKGAGDQALERACERMENHVRTASRVMAGAAADGVEPPADPEQARKIVRETARNMWRGLGEGGLDQLCEQARKRARDQSCTQEDLAAACETATQLQERGVNSERAVNMAGEALRNGYSVQQMSQIRASVATQAMSGRDVDELAGEMERCINEGMGAGEMIQHMVQSGWMGPEGAMGPGGHNPIDDIGGGPGDGDMGGGDGDMGGGDGDGPGDGGSGSGSGNH